MVSFASEPLGTDHFSSKFSRSYLCVRLLYLIAVIVPVLMLYSIGNSWQQYTEIVVQPYVQVVGHQAHCEDFNNVGYYFSSIPEEAGVTSGSMAMAVGNPADGRIDVLLQPSAVGLLSCSITLYLNATIQDGMKSAFIGIATADVYSPTQRISSAVVQSVLKVHSSKPIARSYVPNQYFLGLDGDSEVGDISIQNSLLRMGSRNLTILSQQTTVTVESTTSDTSPPYIYVLLRTSKQALVVENDLKTQVKEFIRQYVYLFVPLWLAIDLAVRWILQNRIYSTRPMRNFTLQ